MTRQYVLIRQTVLTAVAAAMVGFVATSAWAESAALKDAYQNDFLIGVALGGLLPDDYSPAEMAIIKSHFNAVTPENCMKPEEIHPKEKIWDFEEADALVKFAQENGMQVFGHTLVWHNQTPGWFFSDKSTPASREKALERMKTHIETVVGRYKGKIRGWDVVNEAIADGGKEDLRKTKWLERVGDDYILQAFQFAHQADPKAELYYNDFGNESGQKREKTIRLIKSLQAAGVPVAGVGIQGHWMLDHVPFSEIEKAIQEYSALGVKVMFTEVDIDVVPRQAAGAEVGRREAGGDAGAAKISPEVLKRQAEQYAKLFALFRKHPDAITRVTFWGLNDRRTWLNYWPSIRTNHPLLFDRQNQPKPALQAVLDVAAKPAN